MGSRSRQTFDWDWKFMKDDIPGTEKFEYDDSHWRSLQLPHDWSVEGSFHENHPTGGDGGYLPTGIGWYRKHFHADSTWEDRVVSIEFDGVYRNSEVWINGHYLGRYLYGYTSFSYELTSYLHLGESNVISVRVDNSEQPHSRWYTGSGIYRHTWLLVTENVHIERSGVYVTTPSVTSEYADVKLLATVTNKSDAPVSAIVRYEVMNREGVSVGAMEVPIAIDSGSRNSAAGSIRLMQPQLWSDRTPYLYQLRTSVIVHGHHSDETTASFGVRKIEFDADLGFFLNEKQVKLNGVCLHHDGGCVGAAVPEQVWVRRLKFLKEMGCNAIRMSHNPPAPELLDLCDQMGFLVMDEAFDEWEISKNKNGVNTYGYFEYFDEWAERDLAEMLHRDRNHPSIIMWSIGNEIPEQTRPDGHLLARKLIEICRREDPSRPVTVACDNIKSEPRAATEDFLNELDIVGYNYVNRWRSRTETYYEEDRHRYPERKFIGSENIGLGGVRGKYQLKAASTGRWYDGPYYSRMINTEQLWKFTRMHDYVAGDFMWSGIDYLGEARWPDKNASSGVIDLCGFVKDGYYFYQSQWTDKPMVHLFPHWNWEGMEGTVIPIFCYTNCDIAELFLNGKSFGEKAYEFPRQGMTKQYGNFDRPYRHVTTSDLHLSWDVPYERGSIKIVGRKNGAVVCEQEVVTTGKPAKLILQPDRDVLRADGRDVCHFTVKVADEDGRTVSTANVPVTFRIEGVGQLLGTDNGRPDGKEEFKSNGKTTFHGLCLGIVQSERTAGEIRVTVQADGLRPDSVVIRCESL